MNTLPTFRKKYRNININKLNSFIFVLFLCASFNVSAQNNDINNFSIAENIKTQYPELVQLILITESMDDTERQYWFDILPSMNETQVSRLFNILETERVKLAELEVKYQQEIMALNQKHLDEMKARQNTQNDSENMDEDIDPEKILEMLNNL